MSKKLGQLLGISDREFQQFVARLERATAQSGTDIRLMLEIAESTQKTYRQLHLDERDTTPQELYYALSAQLKADDAALNRQLNSKQATGEKLATILAKLSTDLSTSDEVLTMSPAGLKKLLTAVPPRKTLKLLKLRSLQSVLKRYDPRILYSLAKNIEDASWHAQALAKIKRLPAKDIAWQPIVCVPIPLLWYERTQKHVQKYGVTLTCPEAGVVCILPSIKKLKPGSFLFALCLVLHAIVQLAVESTPYRGRELLQGYYEVLLEIAQEQQKPLRVVHGMQPTWKHVHELRSKKMLRPTAHVDDIDLKNTEWQSTEEKLAQLIPSAQFWSGKHYVGILGTDSRPISFHIMDVARSVVADASYEDRSYAYLENALWHEIHMRYLSHDNVLKMLHNQLHPSHEIMVL